MSAEWRSVLLGDVASTRNGAGVKQDYFAPAGIPLARVSNFSAGTIDLADCVFVDTEHAKRWQTHRIGFGDVIVATVGSWPPNWSSVVGKVVRAPERAVGALQNQNTCCVIAREGLSDQRYLYYLLSTEDFVHFASNAAAGSANQARIGISNLLKFPISLPTLREQQTIADFLGALDDRITLLRETNATLEGIAQALFKSWFVDFDPVRAKMQGRAPEGIDEATAALFPDSLEESELGLLPKGWQVANLADTFEINPTRKLAKGSLTSYLDMASLATSGHCVDAPVEREMGSGAKFRNGDTLLARITPCLENGKSAFVDFLIDDEIGWGSTEFLVLRPKAPLPEYFGYLLCRHPIFREYAIQSMVGTSGRQRIQNDVLGRFQLALAGSEITSRFSEIVTLIQKNIAANHQTAQTLATLRDTLLPRLISGALRLDTVA